MDVPSTFTELPQHDPELREEIGHFSDWELRQFRQDDARLGHFLRHGLLHVQLVHRDAGISILTPSRLTRQRWEVFAPGVDRWLLGDLGAVNVCLLYLGLAPLDQQDLFDRLHRHRSRVEEALTSLDLDRGGRLS